MQYIDITKKMFSEAKPREGKVQIQDYYEFNKVKYFVDGHNIVYKHDEREIEVANLLNSTFGGDVKILPNINFPQGIKSPDYIFSKRECSAPNKGCKAFFNLSINLIIQ